MRETMISARNSRQVIRVRRPRSSRILPSSSPAAIREIGEPSMNLLAISQIYIVAIIQRMIKIFDGPVTGGVRRKWMILFIFPVKFRWGVRLEKGFTASSGFT
jgi:hypothetical protein